MANDLSALEPVLFSVAREVAAEPFGIISAINASFDDNGVAIGDKVKVPVAPTRTPSTYTPSNVPATGTSATASSIDVEITNNEMVDWVLTGEQMQSLANSGVDQDWVRQMLAQGMRGLRNKAEVSCAVAGHVGAASAVGTGGTTPFTGNLNTLAHARTALQNRGAPLADLQFCMDTNAGLNLRQLNIFQQADQAGSDAERRSGVFGRQFGFMLKESAGIQTHTAGSASSYLVDLVAGYAKGDTSIHLDGGTGTHLANDVISIAGDTSKYLIKTGGAGDGDKDIVLNGSGLLYPAVDNSAVTTEGSYTANLAFERSAIVGIMRPPHMPPNPTIRTRLVSDQFGLTYLFCEVAQDGQITWRLHLAWGFKAVNEDFITLVLG